MQKLMKEKIVWEAIKADIPEFGSCHDFLDSRLLLTRKLMSQGFILVQLKSSLRMIYGSHHDFVNSYGISVSQITTDIPACSRLSQSQSGSNYINTTGATSGVGTATLPEHPSSPPVFSWVRVTGSLVLCVCFARSLFVLLYLFFYHCIVCPLSIYGFWLLWYLKTFFLTWISIWYLGDSTIACFNRATQHYGLCQPFQIRYRTRRTSILVFVESFQNG
jgi:hypothetical protein